MNLSARLRDAFEASGTKFFLTGETAMGWSDCGLACNQDQYGTISRYIGPHGLDGQFDFVLGASRAPGGRSIIALPSTGRSGEVSRIVPRLTPGAAVTTPRYLVDWVVTEHGAACLRGLGERERTAALTALAEPRFVEELQRGRATP